MNSSTVASVDRTLVSTCETPRTLEPIPRLALRLADVAEALGVSRVTIERLRAAGKFPKPDLQIGKVPLWSPESIRTWISKGGKAVSQ